MDGLHDCSAAVLSSVRSPLLGPRHPRARSFLDSALFADVESFAELEDRIANLPDDKAKGDAFEVFAEAYLATIRKHDAAEVWPLSATPLDLLRELSLNTSDYGVDGICKTMMGSYNAYQVKFRTGRPALTWRELSTFMGLADSPFLTNRILFTNCTDLPSVMNERTGFFCIRGSDLDRLDPTDLREIERWLSGTAQERRRKVPMPHQIEALSALLTAFRDNDRATAIMACATGKTLLALWIAERLTASKVLVLVPSLALLRQTLYEWLHETNWPSLAYL